MTWDQFEAGARAVDLWLGLAVNTWLVVTGVLWFLRRPGTIDAVRKLAANTALWVSFIFAALGMVNLVQDLVAWRQFFLSIFSIFGGG